MKSRSKKTNHKKEKPVKFLGKNELKKLKTAYKTGGLKFDSRKIADAILQEFKEGFTK